MDSKIEKELEYKTVAKPHESEIVINKSRFISQIYPVQNEEEINEILSKVRKEHYKATHVCSAWTLASLPPKQKASDDGEPSGTAGKPILEVIQKNDLKDVLVLVIRYFGGIKLGAGGLIRAYSGSTADVIKGSEIVQIKETATVKVQTEYSFYQLLKQQLETYNIFPVDEEFADIAELTFYIPEEKVERFESIIQNITNDNYLLEVIETGPRSVPIDHSEILI